MSTSSLCLITSSTTKINVIDMHDKKFCHINFIPESVKTGMFLIVEGPKATLNEKVSYRDSNTEPK